MLLTVHRYYKGHEEKNTRNIMRGTGQSRESGRGEARRAEVTNDFDLAVGGRSCRSQSWVYLDRLAACYLLSSLTILPFCRYCRLEIQHDILQVEDFKKVAVQKRSTQIARSSLSQLKEHRLEPRVPFDSRSKLFDTTLQSFHLLFDVDLIFVFIDHDHICISILGFLGSPRAEEVLDDLDTLVCNLNWSVVVRMFVV